jgi:hypothetical protein
VFVSSVMRRDMTLTRSAKNSDFCGGLWANEHNADLITFLRANARAWTQPSGRFERRAGLMKPLTIDCKTMLRVPPAFPGGFFYLPMQKLAKRCKYLFIFT